MLVVGILLAALAPGSAAAELGPAKTLLVLLPGQPAVPAGLAALTGLRSTLRTVHDFPVSIFVEQVWADGADEERRLRDGFRAKYAGLRVDAVAAFAPAAVGFLARWGRDLWPDVPAVAFGVDDRILAGLALPPGVRTIAARFDAEGTVRLALGLLPETRHVALFGGASAQDAQITDLFRADLRAFGDRLAVIDLQGLSLEEMLTRVAGLPDRTVLLGSSLGADRRGRAYFWADVAPLLAAGRHPIFAAVSTAMGTGIVGGSMVDVGELGAEAGRALTRLLRGESVPPKSATEVRPRFVVDWPRLGHWRLDERRLPPGTRVLNREPSLWERFQWHWWHIAVVVIGLGAAGVAALSLLLERAGRRQAQAALEERLRFELLLAEIAAGFSEMLEADTVRARIREGLRQVAGQVGADAAILWEPPANGPAAGTSLRWPEDAASPAPVAVSLDGLPFIRERLLQGQLVQLETLDDLPSVASADRQGLARHGVRSLVAVPFGIDGRVTGALCCVTFGRGHAWSDTAVHSLRTVGEIFAEVLARVRSEAALRQSEALIRGVLASLPSEVAVVDREGVILYVNEQWMEFARQHGGEGNPALAVGANYFEVCRRASLTDRSALQALTIIQSVMNGGDDGQTLQYLCAAAGEQRWFDMQVRRLDPDGRAVVVAHRDVTEQRRALSEIQRTLAELAHLDRLAAVGELASSIAHELNQPLTAILANAQAARRWLATGSPDLDQIRETLDDIISDNRRAGDVIRRIRSLLKKDDGNRVELLDVNDLVREAARLMDNDALLRNTSLGLDLSPNLPKVPGDPVQIQQVLVNLLMNGLQAVADVPLYRRRLVVRTAGDEAEVEVTVQDAGKGIAEADLRRVFEPFFTTKGEGLGIGLSISRSIVEAHGGRIWAENDPDGGAVFRFRLPVPTATAEAA